jgi:very-short-patch-repair endonuclease
LAGSKTGFAFRRQRVIASFIVDFACTAARLVVEVDGGYHDARSRHDAARDANLAALGWQVLHFHDELVLTDVHAVVREIVLAAEARRR